MPAASARKRDNGKEMGSGRQLRPEPLARGGEQIELLVPAPQATDLRETPSKQVSKVLDVARVSRITHPGPLKSASPSPPLYPPCGWRSPTRCRTRRGHARTCRRSPSSDRG